MMQQSNRASLVTILAALAAINFHVQLAISPNSGQSTQLMDSASASLDTMTITPPNFANNAI